MMRGLCTGVVALLLLAACGGAQRGTSTVSGTATGAVASPDASPEAVAGALAASVRSNEHAVGVLREASSAEIATGRLAAERALSTEVRDFARRMVDEHESIDRQAEELARFAGITAALPSDELSRINREELAELSRLSGAAFDRAYMTQRVEAHQRTLILVRAARRASQNDQLSTMLSAVVEPAVRTHLADAEALRASLP